MVQTKIREIQDKSNTSRHDEGTKSSVRSSLRIISTEKSNQDRLEISLNEPHGIVRELADNLKKEVEKFIDDHCETYYREGIFRCDTEVISTSCLRSSLFVGGRILEGVLSNTLEDPVLARELFTISLLLQRSIDLFRCSLTRRAFLKEETESSYHALMSNVRTFQAEASLTAKRLTELKEVSS